MEERNITVSNLVSDVSAPTNSDIVHNRQHNQTKADDDALKAELDKLFGEASTEEPSEKPEEPKA